MSGQITIPFDVWSGANMVNIMIEVIKAHGLKRNVPAELLPAGAFVPHKFKIADETNPTDPGIKKVFCDYWVGNGYGAKGDVMSKINPETGEYLPDDCVLMFFKVRYKYKGEKITIQLNAEQIALISLWDYYNKHGIDSSQWTYEVEMTLDDALADIYSKNPNPIHKSAPLLAEKDHKTKNPDEDYRFGKYL